MRTLYNSIRITIYEGWSTTLRSDAGNELGNAVVDNFSTFFPGGRYGTARITIKRVLTNPFTWQGGDRVVIRNGLDIVFEGEIDSIDFSVGGGAEQSMIITAVGAWGAILSAFSLDKPWADSRLTTAVWEVDTTASGAELATLDRRNRLRITPKAEGWNGETYIVTYTPPTGQTVKRISFNYDFQEAAQAWQMVVYDNTNATALFTITVSGTGSQDITLGAASSEIQFRYTDVGAAPPQTPTSDGTIYAQMTAVTVYTETGAINVTEIAEDIAAVVPNLSSDTSQIESNTLSIEPFISKGQESTSSIISRAASYGDASQNSWNPHIVDSESTASPNGKPLLALIQYPVLTDYDYGVRLDDDNDSPPFKIVKDYGGVVNWVAVTYRSSDGKTITITPDSQPTLKDQDSIDAYGEKHLQRPLNAGNTTAAVALILGERTLAARKTPRFVVSGPIRVIGYIRGKQGQRIPSASIQAGKRIKVENFLSDLSGVTDAGMTFVITGTTYTDGNETCAISTGTPDDLSVFLAQQSLFDDRILD